MKNGVSYVRGAKNLDAFGQQFPVENNVRNFKNGLRKLHDPSEVRLTEPPEGGPGVPFMPDLFPLGEWKILGIKESSKDDTYPFFIYTNVKVLVHPWELDASRGYSKELPNLVWDSGHGLHCSSSGTTLGCLRIGPKRTKEEDTVYIRALVTLLRPYLAKGPVEFHVTVR